MTVSLEVPVAWGDMDAFQHVNNTVYLRWFESARIALFVETGLLARMEADRVGPILARTEIDYRVPLHFPDRVTVSARVVRVGTTSFTLGYRVVNAAGVVAAEGQTVLVLVDYASGAKVPIDAVVRAKLEALGGG